MVCNGGVPHSSRPVYQMSLIGDDGSRNVLRLMPFPLQLSTFRGAVLELMEGKSNECLIRCNLHQHQGRDFRSL